METITLGEAKALVKTLSSQQSLLLLSTPGVGKSDIVRQAAAEAGLECRSLLGTQIAPEDVSGVPRVRNERTIFCPPRVVLPEDDRPFCLFLDELPAAPPDVQKAFYSLLLEQRGSGEYHLPTWVVGRRRGESDGRPRPGQSVEQRTDQPRLRPDHPRRRGCLAALGADREDSRRGARLHSLCPASALPAGAARAGAVFDAQVVDASVA